MLLANKEVLSWGVKLPVIIYTCKWETSQLSVRITVAGTRVAKACVFLVYIYRTKEKEKKNKTLALMFRN